MENNLKSNEPFLHHSLCLWINTKHVRPFQLLNSLILSNSSSSESQNWLKPQDAVSVSTKFTLAWTIATLKYLPRAYITNLITWKELRGLSNVMFQFSCVSSTHKTKLTVSLRYRNPLRRIEYREPGEHEWLTLRQQLNLKEFLHFYMTGIFRP